MRREWEQKNKKTTMKVYVKKNMKKAGMIAVSALAMTGVFLGGTVVGSMYGQPMVVSAEIADGIFTETALPQETVPAVTGLPDVSDIVERCMPSVVSITNVIEVTKTSTNYWPGFGFGYGNNQSTPQTEVEESEAYGSGVIIGYNEDELLIVTNNHVAVYDESGNSIFYQYAASSKELKVTFADGTEHSANLKGADEEADLAVIAVKLAELSDETKAAISVATLGNSDESKIGQGVIAIGNALGMGQSTTIGYISAKDREIQIEDGVTRTLMQVDAAINGGNSGGGLFNGKGELIGINAAKYAAIDVEGIGYAIPITQASEIIDDLKMRATKVEIAEEEKGYLGIKGADVGEDLVSYYGYPKGAQVHQITENSPAFTGGLQLGDIITAVNGDKVDGYTKLRTVLSYYKAGTTVEITVQRINGSQFEEKTLNITLAAREDIIEQ